MKTHSLFFQIALNMIYDNFTKKWQEAARTLKIKVDFPQIPFRKMVKLKFKIFVGNAHAKTSS